MAQVLVRNVDDNVMARLKARARRHGRSLEGEVRDVLVQAAGPERAELVATADAIRALTPDGPQTDSVELIREMRASR